MRHPLIITDPKPRKIVIALAFCVFSMGVCQGSNPERIRRAELEGRLYDPAALERAVAHSRSESPPIYQQNMAAMDKIKALNLNASVQEAAQMGDLDALKKIETMAALKRQILLNSSAIDFSEIMLIQRKSGQLGLPANFHGNSSLRKTGYGNRIVRMNLRDLNPELLPIYEPENDVFVGDLCLHWDGKTFLFSMPSAKGPWQVFEGQVDGASPHQVSPTMETDSDQSDACYLPDGDIIFSSTASMVSVPCVNGSADVANFFRSRPDGSQLRQLCFDQDHNWSPRVMPDGKILFQRWEYTDTPHSNTRLLMTMNPDGTKQRAFYGSNSYWPTSFFYATPVPGHSTRVIGIASGHHGPARVGELVILDASMGTHEGGGVVQTIPGYGKPFNAEIRDPYANKVPSWFLHPHPIDDTRFLVACQPSRKDRWGIYLVDIFDNMLLLHEEPGAALLEPIALRKTRTPPTLPQSINPESPDATVAIANIYSGPGLAGVPAGTVKALRLFTYTFSYRKVGGLYGTIGMDGPWDVKRILGTVPVEPDGSAFFKVPANTPISMQPLDQDGKALALMRSWTTAMPGEQMSCVGCHEDSRQAPPMHPSTAFHRPPTAIAPWQGPERGFSFNREVQPVLDRNCISCHDGSRPEAPDLRGGTMLTDYKTKVSGNGQDRAGLFSTAYANLFPFVRGPGIESDYHLLTPMEFHADTTELVQLLRKGHHGVTLPQEELERIYAWIDMNTPYHGEWSSIVGTNLADRLENHRAENRKRYGALEANHEGRESPLPLAARPPTKRDQLPDAPGPSPRPMDTSKLPTSIPPTQASHPKRAIALGDGLDLQLRQVPAGSFVAGSISGHPDETPRQVQIDQPFWMGAFEVTNAQYALFDPNHDSKVAIRSGYQFGRRDLSMNEAQQPVVRVSLHEAEAFCRWLSKKTGEHFSIPSEEQWEWACRAGTNTPFSFGESDSDFSAFANLADRQISKFAANTSARGYTDVQPISAPSKYDDFIPKDGRFDDGFMITAPVGHYTPNLWGLHDMHGNAAEWTTSRYVPNGQDRVVRGGSWRDRPSRATASFRLPYKPFHKVFNVGFRVVMNAPKIPQTDAGQSHSIICADSGLRKLLRIDRHGEILWEYPDVHCYDLQVLPDGNLLFCDSSMQDSSVIELSPSGTILWRYDTTGEVFSCQRLPNGNTLVGECTKGRLVEVDATGIIQREIPLTFTKGGHGTLRLARKTRRGTYLAAHLADQCVREYDPSGKVIRTVPAKAQVFGVQDLADGHILYSCESGVFEVDADNQTVWQLTAADLPEAGLCWATGIRRLPNGNTLICNWLGHGKEGMGIPIFMVNPDKKIVWKLSRPGQTKWIGSATILPKD